MITLTEVDGVPAVVAPTSGPMRAGLAFRVGVADESLARSGLTHLVEHLALHRLGVPDYHYNGMTGDVLTSFVTQGTDDEIASFLSEVCTSLGDLPLHRLETEKEILRTEAQGRGTSVSEPLAVWRYGARTHGLHGFGELGLPAITPDDLEAWVRRYFTRANAMLWIAGDHVPANLSLTLPDGVRRAVPAATSTLPVTPAFFSDGTGTVGWNAVVPRSTSAGVFSAVLQRVLFRTLRQEDGLSYTVSAEYDPRGDGMATVFAAADALPAKQDAVLGGFVDVLAAMGAGRIPEDDVRAVVGNRLTGLAHPDTDAARLPGVVFDLLTSGRSTGTAELADEVRLVTPESVAAVAGAAMASGLLMTPSGRTADWAGFAPAPATSAAAVAGTGYPSVSGSDGRVVVGSDGVSIVAGDDTATVRYADCVALLAWPDGARVLIGGDAVQVRLEPTLHLGLAVALPGVDARVPPEARVTLPPRDPVRIPLPTDAGPSAVGAGRDDARRTVRTLQLLRRLRFVFAALFLAVTVVSITAERHDGTIQALRAVGLTGAMLCWYGSLLMARRLRVST